MKKYIGYLLIFAPVTFLQAQVKPAASMPVTPLEKNGKEAESLSKVIMEFEGKTITEPFDLVNKWNKLHADMLRQSAQEFREMAPNTEAPGLYRMLARRTGRLSRFMRRPRLQLTKDIQKTFTHTRDWLKLVARQQDLLSQKYAFMATKTSNQEVQSILNSMSKRFELMSKSLNKALAMSPETETVKTHISNLGPEKQRTVEGTQLPQTGTK